jgi:hypothetical protein
VLDLELTLIVDRDEGGERSADACRQRYRAAERDIARLQTHKPGTDFNDLLIEKRGVL